MCLVTLKSRLGLEAMMSRLGLEAMMSRLGRFGLRSSSAHKDVPITRNNLRLTSELFDFIKPYVKSDSDLNRTIAYSISLVKTFPSAYLLLD